MTRIFRTIVMAALPAAILCAAASCTSCHKDNKLEASFTVETDGESPNFFKLTAANQTPSSTYEWTADGSTWQGSTVTCYIGRKGLHNVTLRQTDGDRSGKCTKKVQVTQDSYPFLNGEELWWHDEFNGHALDTRSWNYDTGIGKWGNNEWENYTDSRDNVFLRDGKLVIRAIKTGEGQKIGDYTSGRLTTSGKKEISRGRVEVRAKLPGGNGIWPAIWFFGRKAHPYYSELDIMEYVGCDKNIIYGAVHTTATLDGSAEKVSMSRSVPDVETAFHTYGMEWSDNGISYYLDDPSNVYLRYEPSDFSDPSLWPFDKELYLILNVAVGGDWGGMKGVDDSIFPCEMEVDYVRIFRKK